MPQQWSRAWQSPHPAAVKFDEKQGERKIEGERERGDLPDYPTDDLLYFANTENLIRYPWPLVDHVWRTGKPRETAKRRSFSVRNYFDAYDKRVGMLIKKTHAYLTNYLIFKLNDITPMFYKVIPRNTNILIAIQTWYLALNAKRSIFNFPPRMQILCNTNKISKPVFNVRLMIRCEVKE